MACRSLSHRSYFPQIVSLPDVEPRPTISAIETQVMKLIEDLKSSSIDTQREASAQLRMLARDDSYNCILIGSSGAKTLLVDLLHSTDTKTDEHAVIAFLNLLINDNNKSAIVDAGAVEPSLYPCSSDLALKLGKIQLLPYIASQKLRRTASR